MLNNALYKYPVKLQIFISFYNAVLRDSLARPTLLCCVIAVCQRLYY